MGMLSYRGSIYSATIDCLTGAIYFASFNNEKEIYFYPNDYCYHIIRYNIFDFFDSKGMPISSMDEFCFNEKIKKIFDLLCFI